MIFCYKEDCIHNIFDKANDTTICNADVITITENVVCDEYSSK